LIYLSLLGPKGLQEVAQLCADKASLIEKGFAAGFPLSRYYRNMDNCVLIAVTEKRTKQEIGMLAEALEGVL